METLLLLLMQRKTGIYISFSRKLQQISFLPPTAHGLRWKKTQSWREKQAKLSSSGHFCSFSTSDTGSVSTDAWNLPSSSQRPRRRRSPGCRLAVSQESQSSCLALTEDAEQSQSGRVPGFWRKCVLGFCAVFPTALFNAVVFSVRFTARLTIWETNSPPNLVAAQALMTVCCEYVDKGLNLY